MQKCIYIILTKDRISGKILTLILKAIKGISNLTCFFRDLTGGESQDCTQVKLLPELLPEDFGCVGADGVSPLSRTALLIGKVMRWPMYLYRQ